MAEIKAIIFDWGGVLIDDPAPELVAYCSRSLRVSSEDFRKIHKNLEPEFQKGLISENKFWEKACLNLNVPTPKSQSLWSEAFKKVYSPKKEMFSFVKQLSQSGHKIALLSNTEIPAMEYFYEQNYNGFDILTFSCIEKTRKPEARIYELTLNRLKVKAPEAIFIDDKQVYIEAAKNLGLNTILFKNPFEFKNELLYYSVETM